MAVGTALLALSLAGCQTPEARGGRQAVLTGVHTGDTGDTGDTSVPATGDTGIPEDPCLAEPPPPGALQSLPISTEEDFDFDAGGLVLAQGGSALVGWDIDGGSRVVAVNIGPDAAGIRVLPSGQVLVALPETGTVRRVDPTTGGTALVLTGLSSPNGLEVGVDGQAYASEMAGDRVRRFDPLTGEGEIIAEIPRPNGLALSPDERTLYIGSDAGGAGRVSAIERGDDGAWSPTPTSLFETDSLPALATDVCGNLYAVEFATGRISRRRIRDGAVEELLDLPTGQTSSVRFAPGRGDWSRTALYITDRHTLYALEIGIPGRHVLALDVP
jgi:sugar lactone lactonase YvrE